MPLNPQTLMAQGTGNGVVAFADGGRYPKKALVLSFTQPMLTRWKALTEFWSAMKQASHVLIRTFNTSLFRIRCT